MEWKPIETAPKMKTVLLFAVTDIGPSGEVRNWKMASGFWHSGYVDGHDNSTPWNWEGRQVKTYEPSPTHWMPMPEPPQG